MQSLWVTMMRHHPHLSVLCLPDVIAHDEITQAFALCFCPLHASIQKLQVGMAWERGVLASGFIVLHCRRILRSSFA